MKEKNKYLKEKKKKQVEEYKEKKMSKPPKNEIGRAFLSWELLKFRLEYRIFDSPLELIN